MLLEVALGQSRPFRMGFTLWPADLTAEGIRASTDFAIGHGDLISVMYIGGLPWGESLRNAPFSPDVQKSLSYRAPAGKKLFVSISPLNESRDGMAPYWGEHDNMPLPADWQNLQLDDPKVQGAYLSFCRRVIEKMHPDYLAIGVELNVLLSKNPDRWQRLKTLYRSTYRVLKRAYPSLPVFFTTDIGHYTGAAAEAKGKDQHGEVADLMRDSDIFAMSFYPYGNLNFADAVSPHFLDFVSSFAKPVAVSESGMQSQPVTLPTYKVTLPGSPTQQARFEEFLLGQADARKFRFVVNFATTDFEKLVAKLSGLSAELAEVWAFTGLQDSAYHAKPALVPWDRFYRMPLLAERN